MEDDIERKRIDYKEKFGDRVLRDLCAFANTEGGTVVIGISDDGKVKGIDITNEELEKITEKIVGKLGIYPDIEVEDADGKSILKILVQKSKIPVSFDGKYYERVGNTTREMKPERLRLFFTKDVKWDSLINEEASFDDVDIDTVKKFVRMAKSKGRLESFDEDVDPEILFEHLKLSRNGKLTNGAIMLFGKDPQKFFINAVLRVIRLKDEITPIGDRPIEGNLFKQAVEGEEAIKNFINVRYEIRELVRDEIWDYPLPAIREALINALIHRDYFRWNVQTQIKIYDDHIWFYNIGGLPEGITLDQLKKPHSSVPRNPVIVHVFYLAGLIEEMGTGIGRMIENMKKQDLPEPEFKEEMGGFSVYFRKDPYTEEQLRKLGLNERQIKIIEYLKSQGPAGLSSFKPIFPNVSEKTIYRDLQDLIQKGLLNQVGEKKGRKYKLK